MARMLANKLAWVNITPLGEPVLPEVYCRKAMSLLRCNTVGLSPAGGFISCSCDKWLGICRSGPCPRLMPICPCRSRAWPTPTIEPFNSTALVITPALPHVEREFPALFSSSTETSCDRLPASAHSSLAWRLPSGTVIIMGAAQLSRIATQRRRCSSSWDMREGGYIGTGTPPANNTPMKLKK